MNMYLRLGELDKARAVAERAVRHIDARHEKQRFLVWMAYLNMECTHGDRLHALFKRAVQYNDKKMTFIQLSRIYEVNGFTEEAVEACQKCVAKFPSSKKVWIRILELLYGYAASRVALGSGRDALGEARQALEQGLQKLGTHKQQIIVATAARLEYRIGNIERGQDLFEKLIADHLDRTDIWSQYFDAHIRANIASNDTASIRRLFEKSATLNLKPRKMKFFFSRWLDFEREYGDENDQANVQRRAREYVSQVR